MFVVEVASVQYKHLIVFVFVLEVFNTNSGKPRRGLGVTVKDKMEMTKYIVMGFDCRRFSKPIRSNRKSCQNYLGQFLYLVAKMAKIYYPRPKDSQKVEERKHPKYIPWSVEKE